MNARNAITNYFAHTLRQIRGYDLNSATAIASISNGSVESVSVSFQGAFYRGAEVSIQGPGIVTANAIANVVGGSVDAVHIDIPGGVYAEFITLLSELGFVLQSESGDALGTDQTYIPAVQFVGGGGSGANAYAVVNADGAISSIIVDDGGSGYSSIPSIVINTPSDPIPPATARANCVRGLVESITVTYGSHSYTFVPTVSVSASSLRFNTVPAAVYTQHRYLDDINDFPTITLTSPAAEDYLHSQSGQRIKTMRQFIRGYVYSTSEDSLSDSENLARDIETVVDNFAYLASNLQVYDARVLSLTTDEGLLSPYGLCDLQVEISYYD
jgi:hypothetical protein